MKLVIVESPTKAKTISKFLGKEYEVEASMGHVRDLPKSRLGIDVEHGFTPKYVIPKKAKAIVTELVKKAKEAEKIILATDEDREGEAIAWHLVHALGLNEMKNKKSPKQSKLATGQAKIKNEGSDSQHSHTFVDSHYVERIAFHEITESAIKDALLHPRKIDLHLVDAQQARRILDRIVGYELSPFLWRKIRYGLSAGRVQSVALRIVVEREREIQKFKSEEYWSIEADFNKKGEKNSFHAKLSAAHGKTLGKMDVGSEEKARAFADGAKPLAYAVREITAKTVSRTPPSPFTTSTMQQEAARALGYSAKRTMMIAQNLYEEGHITYMRTDSVHLAASATAQAREVIRDRFGTAYALEAPRVYATKSKGAQEAHEAIRPTNFAKTSETLTLRDHAAQKLYELILKRALASQMQTASLEQTAADIASTHGEFVFRATGQVVKFDGFMRIYREGEDDPPTGGKEDTDRILPPLMANDKLDLAEIIPLQHFTEPPPRFSDATLVKALEADGIGRPSTYAPTLSTIEARGYVDKKEKRFHPTEIGMLVNDLLVEHFPQIVDLKFTAHLEEELDEIADGEKEWIPVVEEFYTPFKKLMGEKEEEVKKQIEVSDTPCPHCGKPMIIKFGRMGKFLACPDPEVKVTLPMPEEAAMIKELSEKTKGEMCPVCGKPMEVKRGRFGYFLGCVDYPTCKGIKKIFEKTGFKCPNCLASPNRKDNPGDIVLKKSRGRGRPFYACSRWPDCTFLMSKKPETEEDIASGFEEWQKKESEPKTEHPKGNGKLRRPRVVTPTEPSGNAPEKTENFPDQNKKTAA